MNMVALVDQNSPPISGAPPFLGVSMDPGTRTALGNAALACGFDAADVLSADLQTTLAHLEEMPTPRLLVIDIGAPTDPMAAIRDLAGTCDPSTRLILLGDINDVDFYRWLLDKGVSEYLVKPAGEDIVATAMRDALTETAPPQSDTQTPAGRAIGIIGCRGGAGTTTLAVNLAWALSQRNGHRTALVDMDLTMGSIAIALDLEPGRGLMEALANPERIDDLFVERAMIPAADNLMVLSAEADLANPPPYNTEGPGALISHLSSTFECIVIDLPRRTVSGGLGMLPAIDELILVCEPTLIGLRDTIRMREVLEAAMPDTMLHIVINNVGRIPKGELDAKTFNAHTGAETAWTLPFEPKAAGAAISEGVPIVHVMPKSKIAAQIGGLADQLLPADATAKGAWCFADFFNRRA